MPGWANSPRRPGSRRLLLGPARQTIEQSSLPAELGRKTQAAPGRPAGDRSVATAVHGRRRVVATAIRAAAGRHKSAAHDEGDREQHPPVNRDAPLHSVPFQTIAPACQKLSGISSRSQRPETT